MLPVLHIDEEALRPRIERAKLRSRRSFSLQDQQRPERAAAAADASIVARLVRSHSTAHAEVSSRLGMRRERCSSCGEPVFLAEKLVVARVVYHRSCFRCARCRHQLTPGNYYETEDGQYCCEACPIDELPDQRSVDLEDQQPPQLTSQREPPDQQQQHQQQPSSGSPPSSSEAALLEAPLSDEEKLEQQLQQQQQQQRSGAAPNDEPEFEHMLKLINDRIDQLTSSGSSTADGDSSPDAAATRARPRSPVHSAPEPSSLVQPSPQHSTEKQQQPQQTSLRRSSSLRLVSEHTKDPQQHQQQQQQQHRRLSLGCRQTLSPPSPPQQQQQHRRRLFEQPSPAPAAEPEPPAVQTQQPRQHENDYPDDLNPFASDDEQQPAKPAASTNPFGSDDDDDEVEDEDEELPPKPMARTKSKRRVLEAPRINLNPFWSDDEEPAESEEAESKSVPPVPRPRTLRHSGTLPPKSNLSLSSVHSSNTSIASSCSTLTPGGTYRKKKPAPPPPTAACLNAPPRSLELQSNSRSTSPRLTPRTRKSKPAPPPPPPPIAASSPQQQQQQPSDRYSTSALPESETELARLRPEQSPAETTTTTVWQQSGDNDKLSKDEANRNTRSLSCTESSLLYPGQLDKSLEGKWKRKKGPAPPRPMPLRRKIKVMSMKDVKLELDQIEMQQQGLERQGVRLEQIIRDKCETGTASEEANLGLDVEELVLELFALVNEKNELFRRQAELMLLRRQQRLEEEHADIEYQVRCLITQPEATKTDFDKQREETLIQRLVEIVEKRNEIVECLEMDRRREIEEDRSIHREMDLYAARNKADNVNVTDESRRSTLKLKKGKLKEKVKEKKSKKSSKKDADKDVDETEAKLKRHTLRKWF